MGDGLANAEGELVSLNAECACGNRLDISTGSSVLRCPKCGLSWEFRPEIKKRPFLIFDHPKKPFEYEIRSDVIIGRDPTNNFITVQSPNDSFKTKPTNVKCNTVSRKHAIITLNKIYETYNKDDSRFIVSNLKCYLRNVGKHGINKNNEILVPESLVELKDQDVLILSPNEETSVKITFEERLMQYE